MSDCRHINYGEKYRLKIAKFDWNAGHSYGRTVAPWDCLSR